jgi:hypothetical protein
MQNKWSFSGALALKVRAHRLRCRSLPPLQPGEAERLLAGFLAIREVTACPTRYAAPVAQRSNLTRNGH